MSTIQSFRQEVSQRLSTLYDIGEARCIVLRLLEERLGLSATQLLLNKDTAIPTDTLTQLQEDFIKLLEGIPLQYILGWTEFYGLRLAVTPSVLIPRPETEELVDLILQRHKTRQNLRILDLGTGSACIPLALASGMLHPAKIDAIELSHDACLIARRNIQEQGTRFESTIEVIESDIFVLAQEQPTESYDLIVSNPPYIQISESKEIHSSVLLNEPHSALFAPPASPLKYYEAIAQLALFWTKGDAEVYVEINALLAVETRQIMQTILNERLAQVDILHDMSGKPRFIHIQLR